jgi:hypothetical protein
MWKRQILLLYSCVSHFKANLTVKYIDANYVLWFLLA